MSIKTAIDAKSGKNSKNIEDAINNLDIGGGGNSKKLETIFDKSLNFSLIQEESTCFCKMQDIDRDEFFDSNYVYTIALDDSPKQIAFTGSESIKSIDELVEIYYGSSPASESEEGVYVTIQSSDYEGSHRLIVERISILESSDDSAVRVTMFQYSGRYYASKSFTDIAIAYLSGKVCYLYDSATSNVYDLQSFSQVSGVKFGSTVYDSDTNSLIGTSVAISTESQVTIKSGRISVSQIS